MNRRIPINRIIPILLALSGWAANTWGQGSVTVSMEELQKNQTAYYGKRVTVDAEIARTFTDNLFTIVDMSFFKHPDLLVISSVPKAEAVTALETSLKPGRTVRITGVVQPCDLKKLDSAYGPLHLKPGGSWTQGPVLIIEKTQSESRR